jgi:hypothetical protein
MNICAFVEAETARGGNVAAACRLLEVARSAFYEFARHLPSRRQLDDQALTEQIKEIHAGSRGTYGWPRVHQALRREGIACSGKRVARLMRAEGLAGRCRRRLEMSSPFGPSVMTRSGPTGEPGACGLLVA